LEGDMKKIINGKSYNTDTAQEIGYYDNGMARSDFGWCEERLYKTSKGAYFLAGRGGPMTKYSRRIGGNCSTGDSDIIPQSECEAKEWAEQHMSAEAYEATFGPAEEA
jgi:hypothetical protein